MAEELVITIQHRKDSMITHTETRRIIFRPYEPLIHSVNEAKACVGPMLEDLFDSIRRKSSE